VTRGPLPTEQVRLMMGARTVGRAHADHWVLDVLAELLEQSLTEDIRYKRGLAYSVSAYNVFFDDAGYFVIATGSERDHKQEIAGTVEIHLERIRRGQIEPAKVAEARAALKGRWALAMEDNLERATWLAQWALLAEGSRHGTEADVRLPDYGAQIDAVTGAELARVVNTYFVPARRYVGLHQPALTVGGTARVLGIAAGLGVAAWLARKLRRRR
jgi:predicted Zn-dependent peptidase